MAKIYSSLLVLCKLNTIFLSCNKLSCNTAILYICLIQMSFVYFTSESFVSGVG
jgi:hypothetical protein